MNTRTVLPTSPDVRSIDLTDGRVIIINCLSEENLPGGTLELRPILNGGRVTWDCFGGTLPMEFRPEDSE